MAKLVVLELGKGDFNQEVEVILEIGEEESRQSIRVKGALPPAPEIPQRYQLWQSAYRSLDVRHRIKVKSAQTTNISIKDIVKDCSNSAESFKDSLSGWYKSDKFSSIREKLFQEIDKSAEVRLIIQTQNNQLRRLPWHIFFERFLDVYRHAEVALSPPEYQRVEKATLGTVRTKVRILAILGNSAGIDIEEDRKLLESLPDAEVVFLVEPQRQQVDELLWDEKGWDIFFFAGHSSSRSDGETGLIYINQTDSLTIPDLKNGLKKALEQGLQLAIFNSCDGLGLANDLASLHIPQIIVMREPVPDRVAQTFLKHFLTAFSRGISLYAAVREARERLQALEDEFPCATWLPAICQNPAVVPISWQDLGRRFIPGFSPYRGLFAFQEEDTSFFFGRESFTAQLVEAVGKHSLIAVIGASGSGKSSVVFAGLIPCLRREGNWRVVSLRPSDRPLYNLASALISRLESGISKTDSIREIRKLATDLQQEKGALRDILGEIEREDSGTRLLLVVDQFEELYTLCQNVEERQRFLDRLLEAVNHTKNFNLVITLRADFVGHALSYRPLADALQYADLKLGPMNRQELQDAIAQPAYQVRVNIEEGLTERILTAVNEAPGNLPLLEFALTQLWEKRRGGILSHAAYDEIGGVEAALARYAQEVYEKLKLEEQQAAKRIFLELTQLGEGTADTRRQVFKQDLVKLAQSEDLIERVIQRLAGAKLIVTSELEQEKIAGEDSRPAAVVDVVHEALIQHWPLLRQWVSENLDALRIQRKIETAAQEWQGKGKPKQAAYLLQGPKLAEAENFIQSYAETVALSSLAQEFVHRSIQQRRKSRSILFGSIGAFVVVVSGAAIIYYQSYWNGTIFAVQTTDFNILYHTLPTKLSYILLHGDVEELRRTLNSNYGFFGLVVTDCKTSEKDCPSQKVLCLTDSKFRWKQRLSVKALSRHPYDLLRNPPPLLTERTYENPFKLDWKATGKTNKGEIIGRVYYVRGVPPSLWEHYLGWWQNSSSAETSLQGHIGSCKWN
ncbi:CHAT domain-containing protein [Argonema galeatum]|uniref:nSTAND1 domain-containing NTPase n=1 Tax=Argonema galeatum TaxID=2942762 RepID=UPI0020128D07|nr:CHAT domain-containing protein [Argonema galeatum]MCL1468152.1 CHAT domain-containing protein [Argonema galeatum A003/A1]